MFRHLASPAIVSLPPEFWFWGVATLLLASGVGFAAGAAYARMSLTWGVRRAGKQLSRLVAAVLEQLERTHEVCSMLESFPGMLLTADEMERLQQRHAKLAATLTRIADIQEAATGYGTADVRANGPADLTIGWQRMPQDPACGLPDRIALGANLSLLLDAGAQAGAASGLLLVKVDRLEQIRSRHGAAGADAVLRRLAGVICLGLREPDLACRYGGDTFAVLLPGIGCTAGLRITDAIRRRVQNHRFRTDDRSPEILVTASFGYAICQPHDDPELALGRAAAALAKSERRGRNQVHISDGSQMRHCLAAV